MPNERNYYVICEDNCRFPGMTSEQILAAIAEATGSTPTHVDDAFITKIREMNQNKNLKFWIGTTAQFNALATKAADTLYILSDDDTEESIEAALTAFAATLSSYGQTLTAFTTKVNEIYGAADTLRNKDAAHGYSDVTYFDDVLVQETVLPGLYMVRVYYNGQAGGYASWSSFMMDLQESVEYSAVFRHYIRMDGVDHMVKATMVGENEGFKLSVVADVNTQETHCAGFTICVRKIGEGYPLG